MLPLISVIVPVYNSEQYLENCINSILKQSYKNIEIILIDDGSTDHSGKICDDFQKVYSDSIRVIHKKNEGVSRARLDGILAAKGDWIGFVDSDDEIDTDMYKRLMQNALEYQANISHCGYQTIVNGGERIHYFYNTGKKVVQNHTEGIKDLLEGKYVEPGLWNKLFQKSLFSDISEMGIMTQKIRYNEDLLLNYILFQKAQKSVYEDFCPYLYYSRNQTATRSKFNIYKYTDAVLVREYIIAHMTEEIREIASKKYLVVLYRAIAAIHPHKEYRSIEKDLRNKLYHQKKNWKYLSKKEYIRLMMIMYVPDIYLLIYGQYEKHFQKKVYE